jgi:hypothetical protein
MVSSTTLNELLEVLAGLTDEEERLRAQLAEIARRKEAVQLTIDVCSEHAPDRTATTPPPNGWAKRLAGLTQKDALRVIAQEYGGLLKVTEAKRILVTYGLAKGKPRYVRGHLYNLLSESDEYEHVEPGVYRLRESDAPSQTSLLSFATGAR